MIRMRRLLFSMSGFFLYLWLVAKRRSTYKGGNEFYKIAQCEHHSLAKQIAVSFLKSPLSRLFEDYKWRQVYPPRFHGSFSVCPSIFVWEG